MCETGWVGLVGGEGGGQEAQAALRKGEGGACGGGSKDTGLGKAFN